MPQTQNAPSRPRLVLSFNIARDIIDSQLIELVEISDMAALILYDSQKDEARLQKRASLLVKAVQAKGVALLIEADARIGMRIGADGVHREDGQSLHHKSHNMMVGYGNIRDRHQAMILGETGADYLLFGKLGSDHPPEPHPRNLRLSHWWANVMEVPCLVQAGSDMEALPALAATGAEFILIEEMVFSQSDPHAALIQINQRLDKTTILSQNTENK